MVVINWRGQYIIIIPVQMHHEPLQEALPGHTVGFNVKNASVNDLKPCYVASNSMDDPAKEAANSTS